MKESNMQKDRWGKYHILTGHESPETCFWCGRPCKNRFCSAECKLEYWRHFHWAEARDWCLERAEHKCEKCRVKPACWVISAYDGSLDGDLSKKNTRLEVHHIVPINSGRRDWNVLNRPENLQCLCAKCHRKVINDG